MVIESDISEVVWNNAATKYFLSPLLLRCFAALGNVSKARFLNKTNKIVDCISKEHVCIQTTSYSFDCIIHSMPIVSVYEEKVNFTKRCN